MSEKSKTKKKTLLSDQISSLFTVTPRADPEDDVIYNTKPKTVTKDDLESDGEGEANALSSFRKQNVALLADISDKYAGVVSARTQSESEDDSDHSLDDANSGDSNNENLALSNPSDNEIDEVEEEADNVESEDDSEKMSDEEDASEEDFDDGDDFNMGQMDETNNAEFTHIKETNLSEEVKKGQCVKNQLSIWENFLETRINIQKCLITANKMPLFETFADMKKENPDQFVPAIGKTKGNITMLLSRLLELQSHLLGQYPETKNVLNQSNSNSKTDDVIDDDLDEEIPSDSEPEDNDPKSNTNVISKINRKRKFNDYSLTLSDRHASYSKYRNSVIQKWHDKIKLTATQIKNQPATSVLSQIDFILGDKNKLIRKTQLKRSKYDIVGYKQESDSAVDEEENADNPSTKTEDEYNTEIFDDDDFYHQLLRELIEHKSADISDPIQLSQQWIALQQLRSKLKRKIDTRATKGRRIRYAVHSKLVNFMAPVKNMEWTEEGKDELFASLFGKQYENNV